MGVVNHKWEGFTCVVVYPGGSTGSGSPNHRRGRSPPYTGPVDLRGRAASSGSLVGLGVQLRNKDGKQRSSNSASRRSKNMEKNGMQREKMFSQK